MTVYFVTRHKGALQWAQEQQIHFDVHLTHLVDLAQLQAGDIIIGTLPIQLVATLNARHIRYLHLSLQIPAHLRGMELNVQQLRDCHICLEEFHVTRTALR